MATTSANFALKEHIHGLRVKEGIFWEAILQVMR